MLYNKGSHHPIWRLAHVLVVCVTLLILQLITATNYDVAIDGEAGTLVGVGAIALLSEFLRKS